ncbi:MAG: decaprenyl-phosphate phosphoribosyltransferase [bacterium]|nr:decaprenyl-phosphate phosphoribosyltransferase [bacterium]
MFLSLINLARLRQWLKNGVVLAALIFAGQAANLVQIRTALLATIIFCLLSSSVYILNDLIDREQDKNHPVKKNRPIASGQVSLSVAIIAILLLAAVSLVAGYMISREFFVVALAFLVLNALYSLWLKHGVIIDVMSISISFVLRAYAGAVAISVPASKWLLLNTLFLALFLALGKRRHEILLLEENAIDHRKILDRYSPYLLDQMIGVVTASVVVMYMLYTLSTEVSEKLNTENLFVTIPFVVYGIFRYLYLIHKEEKGGSPTSVLISDTPILIDVILWIMSVFAVLYVL